MKRTLPLISLLLVGISGYSPAATAPHSSQPPAAAPQRGESDSRFDAAPFGLPLPEGNGVMWEDPREIHEVIIDFSRAPQPSEKVRLEYWGSRWPEQHLPKDRQPGGADVGWMELGNWYNGGWRVADAQARTEGSTLFFTFRAVNAKEFPALKDYGAAFRYTFKIRLTSDQPLPTIERIEAFTDSMWKADSARLEWARAPGEPIKVQAFNGRVESLQNILPSRCRGPQSAGDQDSLRPRRGKAGANLARRLCRLATQKVGHLFPARAGRRTATVSSGAGWLRPLPVHRPFHPAPAWQRHAPLSPRTTRCAVPIRPA